MPVSSAQSGDYSQYTFSKGTVDDTLACIIPQVTDNINLFSLQMASLQQNTNCWSFSSLVSFAVLSHYDSGFPITIQTANKTLNVLKWLSSNTGLTVPARSVGLSWMSMLPQYNAEMIHALNYVQCDGMNCLLTLPTYWSLNSSIAGFGYGMAAVMVLLCMVTGMVIWQCRRRVVVKSASVIFLLLILCEL